MKYDAEEVKKARKLSMDNFNNLPIEIRKSLASPDVRLLELDIAIGYAEKHLANLKKRRGELIDWLMDWYREQIKEESK